jgi:hypothetical protein
MTKDEVLKLALDWLESGNFVYPTELRTAIKEALAQPAQRPWVRLSLEEQTHLVLDYGRDPILLIVKYEQALQKVNHDNHPDILCAGQPGLGADPIGHLLPDQALRGKVMTATRVKVYANQAQLEAVSQALDALCEVAFRLPLESQTRAWACVAELKLRAAFKQELESL